MNTYSYILPRACVYEYTNLPRSFVATELVQVLVACKGEESAQALLGLMDVDERKEKMRTHLLVEGLQVRVGIRRSARTYATMASARNSVGALHQCVLVRSGLKARLQVLKHT